MDNLARTALVLFALTACGQEQRDALGADAASVETDAAMESDADSGAGTADASTFQPPLTPSTFQIELSRSACFGNCPMYKASLDQAGRVTFGGEGCVARPGFFSKQVAPENARALYDAFVSANFWSLRDRYVDESDGCSWFGTDFPSSHWRVVVDGHSKILARYHGCKGVKQLEALDALEPLMRQQTGIDPWLEPNPNDCLRQEAKPGFELAPAYRIGLGERAIGVLKLDARRYWELLDCAGAPVASGRFRTTTPRLVLFAGTRCCATGGAYASGVEQPIHLPAELGEIGSIVIESGSNDAGIVVRGLRPEDEIALSAVSGSDC